MKEEFLDYIEDIIDAMNDAMSFVEGMKCEDFVKDRKTIYAVVRALEIIGEAAKRMPDLVRNRLSPDPLERHVWNERQTDSWIFWI
jgi:uncharacterized protein with HEPN domain